MSNYTLGDPYAITPVYETLTAGSVLTILRWKDISDAVAQSWLNTVTAGPTWTGNQASLTYPGGRVYNVRVAPPLILSPILQRLTFASYSRVQTLSS